MRATKLYIKTYKEMPTNCDNKSHALLVRASMIAQQGSGLYAILPLGLRVLHKIEKIIREELYFANEMALPLISPKSNWDRAARWDKYGKEMIRLKDRKEREYALQPTAEIDFLNLLDKDILSYKDFPIILYQMTDKFRDEIRPRFGLLRSRQFKMKDAYSFHTYEKCLDETFDKFVDAYKKIFDRLELKYKICEADTGAIGGKGSLEFIVMVDSGEAEILYSECGYAANIEKATNKIEKLESTYSKMTEIHTPGMETIEDVAKYLEKDKKELLKTLILKLDHEFYAIVLRGDRELNEHKLASLGFSEIEYATEQEISKLLLVKGYVSPNSRLKVIADEESIYGEKVIGANKVNYHCINAIHDRDWKADIIADIRQTIAGDACKKCGTSLKSMKGIEVGHVFKIGDEYSKAMKVNFIDDTGRENLVLMSSYGIGISRLIGTLVEQNNKDNKINWPEVVAPFKFTIIYQDSYASVAAELYEKLALKHEVLLDDRDLSIIFKIKDAELIGIPYILVIGKNYDGENLELINKGVKKIVKIADLF